MIFLDTAENVTFLSRYILHIHSQKKPPLNLNKMAVDNSPQNALYPNCHVLDCPRSMLTSQSLPQWLQGKAQLVKPQHCLQAGQTLRGHLLSSLQSTSHSDQHNNFRWMDTKGK